MKEESKKPVVAALDVGFGYTKGAISNGQVTGLVFPSRVGEGVFTKSFFATTKAEVDFIVKSSRFTGEKIYYAGETAVRLAKGGNSTTDQAMFLEKFNPLLTIAGLARMVLKKSLQTKSTPIIPDLLVVGLPVDAYDKYHETLSASLSGKHEVSLFRQNGDQVGQTLQMDLKVEVVPQGLGAFCAWAFTPEGDPIPERMGGCLVLDGGAGTFDCAAIDENGLHPTHSRSFPSIMGDVYLAMQRAIQKATGRFLTSPEIDVHLAGKPLSDNDGKVVNVAQIQAEALAQHQDRIVGQIASTAMDFVADKVLITGGSGVALHEAIKRVIPKAQILVPDVVMDRNPDGFHLSQMANAVGMLRYGRHKLKT